MMYTVVFWTSKIHCVRAVVEYAGVSPLTNLLENNKIKFEVWMVQGGQVRQQDLGHGGFQYWLNPGESFFK